MIFEARQVQRSVGYYLHHTIFKTTVPNIKTASNLDIAPEIAQLHPKIIVPSTSGTLSGGPTIADAKLLVRGKQATAYGSVQSLGQSLLTSSDRRTEVTNPSISPWQMICLLKITAKDGSSFIGTGWIAGPRLVVTAGHCLYHEDLLGGWADDVQVLPGHCDSLPATTYKGLRFETSMEWRYKGDENLDIGAVFVAEDIGSIHGTFGVGTYPENFYRERLVNISGYPIDYYGDAQVHHANRIKTVTKSKLYYDVDTEQGQSGSPVWVYESDELNNPIVIGVHAHGAGNTDDGNSGVRITHQVFQLINGWLQKPST